MRQLFPKLSQLFRISCTNNSAYRRVAVTANLCAAPGFTHFAHDFVNRLAVNQAMLLEQSAKEQTEYTFPEKFTGDWVSQEGRLTIHADAQVVAELGTVLPTATVTPRDFTQEDVDTLLRVLLKGQPLYSTVMTKQECQDSIDYVNSPEWHADPDAPEQTPEQLEARRQEIIAYYTAEMAKAPEEKPIIHGFEDSGTPNEVSGDATVDGAKYEINIMNRFGGGNEEGGVIV